VLVPMALRVTFVATSVVPIVDVALPATTPTLATAPGTTLVDVLVLLDEISAALCVTVTCKALVALAHATIATLPTGPPAVDAVLVAVLDVLPVATSNEFDTVSEHDVLPPQSCAMPPLLMALVSTPLARLVARVSSSVETFAVVIVKEPDVKEAKPTEPIAQLEAALLTALAAVRTQRKALLLSSDGPMDALSADHTDTATEATAEFVADAVHRAALVLLKRTTAVALSKLTCAAPDALRTATPTDAAAHFVALQRAALTLLPVRSAEKPEP